jgi:hypothetical protein
LFFWSIALKIRKRKVPDTTLSDLKIGSFKVKGEKFVGILPSLREEKLFDRVVSKADQLFSFIQDDQICTGGDEVDIWYLAAIPAIIIQPKGNSLFQFFHMKWTLSMTYPLEGLTCKRLRCLTSLDLLQATSVSLIEVFWERIKKSSYLEIRFTLIAEIIDLKFHPKKPKSLAICKLEMGI